MLYKYENSHPAGGAGVVVGGSVTNPVAPVVLPSLGIQSYKIWISFMSVSLRCDLCPMVTPDCVGSMVILDRSIAKA